VCEKWYFRLNVSLIWREEGCAPFVNKALRAHETEENLVAMIVRQRTGLYAVSSQCCGFVCCC
jgi:hypothetical protein